jgi:NAD(P)-dependent dehydrogenase (short-subunit alcohol dehydrogenase family)
VRVNVVNPDAIVHGAGMWHAGWRKARAKGMRVPPHLEEAYRQRTTRKANIYTEAVAEAILVFASDRPAKPTGGILKVDGRLAAAYVR